jgi:putative restriction endonuclease
VDPTDRDIQVRIRAFEFLDEQRQLFGGDLPWAVLHDGFEFDGRRVPLVGPQGIFKPKILSRSIPLSITTAPIRPGKARPYDDSIRSDGFLTYKYRGTDPNHHENEGLRAAMREQVPLIYLVGIAVGWYSAAYPAYIVGDDADSLAVTVAIDDSLVVGVPRDRVADRVTEARRAYATQVVRRRIHQDKFRHNVLVAYRDSCAICNLKHRQLLEAAHILPDSDPRGTPEVSNGLSLCRLHHAAFDSYIVGIRPDLIVEVRDSVRKEKDGPMLLHGLQNCHGQRLVVVPRRDQLKPREDLLAERYDRFRRAG